jgi:hypothetical protein
LSPMKVAIAEIAQDDEPVIGQSLRIVQADVFDDLGIDSAIAGTEAIIRPSRHSDRASHANRGRRGALLSRSCVHLGLDGVGVERPARRLGDGGAEQRALYFGDTAAKQFIAESLLAAV